MPRCRGKSRQYELRGGFHPDVTLAVGFMARLPHRRRLHLLLLMWSAGNVVDPGLRCHVRCWVGGLTIQRTSAGWLPVFTSRCGKDDM